MRSAGGLDYATAIARVRAATADCQVVVFDLDGVVRDYRDNDTDLDARLGLAAGTWEAAVFWRPHLEQVVTGRITFEQWCHSIGDLVTDQGADPQLVAEALQRWVAYRGTPIAETIELIEQLRAENRAVFAFTNGTDNVAAELRQLGLESLAVNLLNSADFGVAKPDPAAFAAAHAAIESALGTKVDPGQVGFTDDRTGNVEAAIAHGWVGVHFDAGAPAPADV